MREVNVLRAVEKLNGIWEMSLDKRFGLSNTYTISVPSCVGNEVPALRDYRGTLWYRKNFYVGNLVEKERRVFIRFGAVNYYAEVWLNNSFIGSHEGGYNSLFLKLRNTLSLKMNSW